MKLGKFLAKERRKKGVSQLEASVAIGMSPANLSSIESGITKCPTNKYLVSISRYYGVKVSTLRSMTETSPIKGNNKLGNYLCKVRIDRGLSIDSASRLIGVCPASIYGIESGRSLIPRKKTLGLICKAYDIKMPYLKKIIKDTSNPVEPASPCEDKPGNAKQTLMMTMVQEEKFGMMYAFDRIEKQAESYVCMSSKTVFCKEGGEDMSYSVGEGGILKRTKHAFPGTIYHALKTMKFQKCLIVEKKKRSPGIESLESLSPMIREIVNEAVAKAVEEEMATINKKIRDLEGQAEETPDPEESDPRDTGGFAISRGQ